MGYQKLLTQSAALLLLGFTNCATVNEVVEAYGSELGWVQRTAKPNPQAKIDYFTHFNEFLKFEVELETMGDISFEMLLEQLVHIQKTRSMIDAVYCDGDLCDPSLADTEKTYKPGFLLNERTFPTDAGDITLPESLKRLQDAQKKILERQFSTCAAGQMRLYAQNEHDEWGPVKISYRVLYSSLNPKMDFPAWPVSCSKYVQAGNSIPSVFKDYRKNIRRFCGQKIDFESTNWEVEQKTVAIAEKKAFAKCWLKSDSRRWFMDAIPDPELFEKYPGLYNSDCYEKEDYICHQLKENSSDT